jgi:diguanylate cyclase (GGDEF)-like protein/PAS domain S-box-containing protein
MYSKFHKNFLKILFTIILPILFIVMVFSLYLVERLSQEKRAFLFEKSITLASLISHIAVSEKKYSKDSSSTETINQVHETFQSLNFMGLELEYLVGKISDGKIEFIAYSDQKPTSIKFENANPSLSMKKVLGGKEGVGVGYDNDGQKVFASYQPIENTNWGLVIKQPYSMHIKAIYTTSIMASSALVMLIIFIYIFLKKTQEKHRKKVEYSERRYQQIVESSNDFIWEVDINGVYKYTSHKIKNILGYSSEEMLGKQLFDFMSIDEAKRLSKIYRKIISQEIRITDLENSRIHKNGPEVHFISNGSPFYDESGKLQGYRGVDRDVTLLTQKQQEIEHLAFYDTLTGLANRENISERITQEINYTKRNNFESALLFLDLDDFKQINDTYGHDHGDEVLRVISSKITKSIRNFDVAARIGGDEFIILVRGVKENKGDCLSHLDDMIQRILNDINEPINFKGIFHKVGVSIGVAILPEDGKCFDELLKHADSAMYEAKHLGKNRVEFYKKVI